jgi:putative DNA primase/helicase
MQATGIPTWSTLSASGLLSIILPALPLASDIYIFVDHDNAGVNAAEHAAARFFRERRCVRLLLPPTPGSDFNDVLRGNV